MIKYSLILPVYNEEENIEVLYKRLIESLKPFEKLFELIFVDDGSTDKSLELLRSLRKNDKQVKIISFSRNFGHQTAVTAGLDHVTGDYIAILDADLQDPPEVLGKFFLKLDEGYDVVSGWRWQRRFSRNPQVWCGPRTRWLGCRRPRPRRQSRSRRP